FNEEPALERSVRRLHAFLRDGFPFSWRIVIADNASTDATPQIADRLAAELPEVEALRLEAKGRGRALRTAWTSSSARVVAYMDVDLSTDLRATRGRARPHALSPTWTSICRRTCARCCRSSRRCCPATATSRSARAWQTAPTSCAAQSAS